jgi:hypothetical protein
MSAFWVLYFVVGVITALYERAYFGALASKSDSVVSVHDAGEELASNPGSLFRIVPARTGQYLRALVTRQNDPQLERRRLLALGWVVALIALFIFGAANN